MILILLGLIPAPACAPGSRPDLVPIALRFIEEDPDGSFDGDHLFDEDPVFNWTFRTPEDLSWWRLALVDKAFPPEAERAILTSTRRAPRLFRKVQIDAASIDAIRLVTEGLRHEFAIYWAPPGKPIALDRGIRAKPTDTARAGVKIYDFPMASHPLWKGRIGQIRLDPTGLPKQRFQLHKLTAMRLRLVPERLRVAVDRPWKVDLQRDVRNAYIAPPGRSIERALVVPRNAELQFAYGFLPGRISPPASDPIQLRVSARRGDTDPTVLFEGTVDPAPRPGEKPRWQERTVDLAPFEGQQVRLVLETAANPSWQPIHGFPVWANPEVLHRTARTPDGGKPAGSGAPKPSPPNVILVSVDSLRADHLSLYGYPGPTSPNIDAWARRAGVTFTNPIVQAPSTLPSHVSLLTGLDAFDHQVNHGPAPASLTMLAEVLRRAGYVTVAATGGGYLGPESGLAQGFDRYSYWAGGTLFELMVGMQGVLSWLEANADRPFFVFLHTLAVHSPYRERASAASQVGSGVPDSPHAHLRLGPVELTAADGFRTRRRLIWPDGRGSDDGRLSSQQQASVTSLYDSGIAHADEQLGRLFKVVDDLTLERDTLLILTSDHGEALGEHDRVGHGYLSDDNVRVPLVLAFPRRLSGGKMISTQVRSIDILPTVLELVGLPPLPGIDGVSLVSLIEQGSSTDTPGAIPDAWTYAASTNFGVSLRIANRMKYVFNNTPWEPIRGTEELYRLEEDPGEDNNVAVVRASETDGLRTRVHDRLRERPGLRIRFANGGSHAFRGTIRSSWLDPARIKTADLPCACVTWEEGQLQFAVPPGRDYTLLLENPERGPLALAVTIQAATDAPPAHHELEIDPARLTAATTLAFTGSGWDVSNADEQDSPGTGLRLWWQGLPYVQDETPVTMSERRRLQLDTLGYVE